MEWFWRFWSRPRKSDQDPDDKRWSACSRARFLSRGHLCICRKGSWETEYIYDVVRNGEKTQVRIVLPESFVSAWEKSIGQRMTEPMRSELAKKKLSAVAAMKSIPATNVIDESAVKAMCPSGVRRF